ncbi:MAG: Ig-like domain-containing protein, partial [Candidatus Hodarchaeales archaeon]
YPNDFTNIQGTSMSCPFVSGSLALLLQAMGGYDYWESGYGSAFYPFKAKQMILMTANEIYIDSRGEKDSVEGYGRLNIYAAIEAFENTYVIGTQTTGYLSDRLSEQKVWASNVLLSTGVNYSLELEVPYGADYDLFVYEPNPNQFGEPIIAAKSANFDSGANEYLTFTPYTSGSYYIVVKTTFTNSGSGEFNLSSTSGNNYPSVSIISPVRNERLTGQIAIQIDASDSDLSTVYFKTAADTWINTTFTGTYYEYTYNTTALPDDNYTFIAKAVDNQGDISYSKSVTTYTDNFEESILLVDDDEGNNSEIYYERALSKLLLHKGLSYDYYSVLTSGSPSLDTLKKYQLVIWFTSEDRDSTLTATDQSNLESYLDQGGYLLISGQDIGFDINSDSFYGDYLHAVYQGDSVSDKRYLSGENSDIFEGKRYYIGYGAGSGHNEYPSDIDANFGASVILNYYGDSNYGAGVKYNDTHKVIYFSFNWEAIDDEFERIDCLNLSLNWFNLDQQPYGVFISNPLSGSATNENVSLSWSGIDDIDIERYEIFRDGVHITKTIETAVLLGNQPEGWHSYRILAVDMRNQSYAGVISIFVDRTPPTVRIDSPGEIIYASSTLTVSLSGDAVNYWYYIEIIDDLNETWIVNIERMLAEGDYTLHAFGNDSVGNIQHISIAFSIDLTPPIVNIESPTNLTYARNILNVSLSGDATNYWYYIETIDIFNVSWTMIEDRTLSDGTYTINAYGNDSAGNEACTSNTFTIDTTPPDVNIESPVHQLYFNRINISLTGNAQHYWYYIEGDDIENHTWSDDLTQILENGSYTLHAYGNDSTGNEAHVFMTFSIIFDLTPPEIILHSMQNESILVAGTQIHFNVTDSNLDTVAYNWNNLQNSAITSPYSVVLLETVGNHTLFIFANDSAGNWISMEFVFIIEEPTNTTSEPISTDGTSSSNDYTSTTEKTSTIETLITRTSSQESEEKTTGFFLFASIIFLTSISLLRRKIRRH